METTTAPVTFAEQHLAIAKQKRSTAKTHVAADAAQKAVSYWALRVKREQQDSRL